MNFLIGFFVGLESALLLLDQTFYWRSMITIGIFFIYALNGFNYKRLREKIPTNLFLPLISFILYFYLNYDFFFTPEIYSRWGLTQEIYYFFSTPILIIIFLLLLGGKNNKQVKEFIFSFSLTFAFLGFFLNIIDFHGTENENFLAVRFLTLIPLFFIFFKSFFIRLLFLVSISYIVLYFNSRTVLVAILFFISLYCLRNVIFSSKKLFFTTNFLACIVISVFPFLFLYSFQENSLLTGVFLSDSKGVDGRFLIWAEILLRVSEYGNFVFGNGSNHDTVYYESGFFGRNLSSHNMVLETFFRLGIIGYVLMISILFQLLNYCYERRHIYSIQLGWILTLCGMFLASLYEYIFFDGSGVLNNIVFWFTLGVLLFVNNNKESLKNKELFKNK